MLIMRGNANVNTNITTITTIATTTITTSDLIIITIIRLTCDDNKHLKSTDINDGYCDCDDGFDEPGTSACINGSTIIITIAITIINTIIITVIINIRYISL